MLVPPQGQGVLRRNTGGIASRRNRSRFKVSPSKLQQLNPHQNDKTTGRKPWKHENSKTIFSYHIGYVLEVIVIIMALITNV